MRWINAQEVQWQRFSAHRPGFAQNKRLLSGDEGSQRNYELSIVECRQGYATPKHQHNFDQFRFMLKGRFGVAEDVVLEEGTISYFAEGVRYTQIGIGTSHTLLLQFGGASGNGFMSYEQLERGHQEVSKEAEFKDGKCTRRNADGELESVDAYQAIWEHINARPIDYPEARYNLPVIANPERFGWQESEIEPGVAFQNLGRFSEVNIGMGMVRVARGASHLLDPNRLYFLKSGKGNCGEHLWDAETAADPSGEEGHIYQATDDSIFVFYDRPLFANE